jgi:hypothetical protein
MADIKTKTYFKVGALVVAGIIVFVLFFSHPIVSVVLGLAGLVFWAVDSGKVNV